MAASHSGKLVSYRERQSVILKSEPSRLTVICLAKGPFTTFTNLKGLLRVFYVHYVIVPISNGSFLHYKLSLTEQQENVAVVKPLSNNCITRYLSGSKCSY